jgi:hypothetical protein
MQHVAAFGVILRQRISMQLHVEPHAGGIQGVDQRLQLPLAFVMGGHGGVGCRVHEGALRWWCGHMNALCARKAKHDSMSRRDIRTPVVQTSGCA